MNIYRPEGTLITEVKNNEYTCSIEGLERALRQGVILEGRVLLCDAFMNLHVDFGNGLRGIIPKDECQYSEEKDEVKDIAILTRVGKTVCFKVIGFKETGTKEKCAVLSRRQAQIECKQYYVDTLSAGDVILARITHLEHFGAFAYSREEGTPAYKLPDQVDEEIKQKREEIIMREQQSVYDELAQLQVGKTIRVFTEGYDNLEKRYIARAYTDAPEIDDLVFYQSKIKHSVGDFVNVRIDEIDDHNIYATEI
jgi:predicted RNA-binding protein with RPS1 domain